MAIKGESKAWILILLILSGIVVGGLVGELTKNIDWLSWLGYGQEFGLSNPLTLDINVLKLTFGLTINFNIAAILGILIAIFCYYKFIK